MSDERQYLESTYGMSADEAEEWADVSARVLQLASFAVGEWRPRYGGLDIDYASRRVTMFLKEPTDSDRERIREQAPELVDVLDVRSARFSLDELTQAMESLGSHMGTGRWPDYRVGIDVARNGLVVTSEQLTSDDQREMQERSDVPLFFEFGESGAVGT